MHDVEFDAPVTGGELAAFEVRRCVGHDQGAAVEDAVLECVAGQVDGLGGELGVLVEHELGLGGLLGHGVEGIEIGVKRDSSIRQRLGRPDACAKKNPVPRTNRDTGLDLDLNSAIERPSQPVGILQT